MAEQEFLVSFAVEIDEGGLDKMQQALQRNREMAEQLAGAFESAQGAISAFFDQLSASTLSTGEISPWQRLQEMSEEGISVSFEVDFARAQEDLDAFLQAAEEPLLLTADASGVLSAGQAALAELQGIFASTTITVRVQADTSGLPSSSGGGGGSGGSRTIAPPGSPAASVLRAANGGRFTDPTRLEIAEDGDPE